MITTLQILSDTIAGWLLIIVLTCTLPLINNVLLKQLPPSITTNVNQSIKLHPSLPNIQSFQLLNCFVLYLLSFPILLMYRNVSTFGNILGTLGFSIGLIVILGFGVGPAMLKIQEEVEAKEHEEKVKEYYKKEKESGDDDSPWKQVNKASTPAKVTLETSSHSLPEAPTSPSEEEEDDTYGSPLQKHRNLSSSSLKKKHRKSHSISATSDNDSLLKEMDGNLIDSNLEPHYSNLIDSANAPIFGVGKF